MPTVFAGSSGRPGLHQTQHRAHRAHQVSCRPGRLVNAADASGCIRGEFELWPAAPPTHHEIQLEVGHVLCRRTDPWMCRERVNLVAVVCGRALSTPCAVTTDHWQNVRQQTRSALQTFAWLINSLDRRPGRRAESPVAGQIVEVVECDPEISEDRRGFAGGVRADTNAIRRASAPPALCCPWRLCNCRAQHPTS